MNSLNRDLVIGEVIYYRGMPARVLSGPGMSTSQIMSDDLQIEFVDPKDGEIETVDAMAIQEDEGEWYAALEQQFSVLSVSRVDLESSGFDPLIDTETMERLAREMINDHLMQAYWMALEHAAQALEIPKLSQERRPK